MLKRKNAELKNFCIFFFMHIASGLEFALDNHVKKDQKCLLNE